MSNKNIILTGFMGSGKSAVGKALADRLGYRFVDTDRLIEARAGRTVAEIFEREGEESFRAWEANVARALAEERATVIATGGRLMLDSKNAQMLGSNGQVFCLTANPDEIVKRLQMEDAKRPLLAVPNPDARIMELLAKRAEGYARFPQIRTDNKSIEQVATEIQLLMNKRIIGVTYPGGSYNVAIGSDLLPHVRELAGITGPVAVITDSNVGPLYANQVRGDMVVTIPAGEQYKTPATVNQLYSQLLAAGLDRQGTIIALGGGVVGDVAGFVAATFMRGIDFVQIPTSLLAMVDASVGGKTGVDLPEGKNLVGAFKQPQIVLADLVTLSTLPDAEFSAGMAEVIKGGIIADPELFKLVENQAAHLMSRSNTDLDLLEVVVGDSVEVKRKIVQEDPYEQGRRAVLNLGHTFGHAIEQVSGYSVRHGEAVAMGLVASAHMSAALGHCYSELEPRIAEVLNSVSLPTQIPQEWQEEAILAAMASDKKKATGRLRFVLPRAIGDVFVTGQISEDEVLATLRYCGAG